MAKQTHIVNGDGLGPTTARRAARSDDGYCLLNNRYQTNRQLDKAVGANLNDESPNHANRVAAHDLALDVYAALLGLEARARLSG